jgi:hypothetical protein
MLNKKSVYYFYLVLSVFFLIISFESCTDHKSKIDTGKININSSFQRFDQDLFQLSKPLTVMEISQLRKKYPSFFDLFCGKIIHIPSENDSVIAANLNLFISDKDVVSIHNKTVEVFKNTDWLKDDLIEMLKYFHYYFPVKPVPDILTYISAFNYAVITTDSIIGIGLDMYLF